jgi:3-hydroxymyristoyl/3-hydroxydecanoyl-(acyl carrier protein) dehydratase
MKLDGLDRIAIQDATLVLMAIVDRIEANQEFARHFQHMPVPGGKPIIEFMQALSAVASRYPKAMNKQQEEAISRD